MKNRDGSIIVKCDEAAFSCVSDIFDFIWSDCSNDLIDNLLKCIQIKQDTQTYDYLLKQAKGLMPNSKGKGAKKVKERMDQAFDNEKLVNTKDSFRIFYRRYDFIAGDPCYRYSKKAMETYLKSPYYCILCYAFFLRNNWDDVRMGSNSNPADLTSIYDYLRE